MDEYGFLHIGKTGGTAINTVFRKCVRRGVGSHVAIYPHTFNLKQIVEGNLTQKVIFFVREPVSRYVSAFNSRLRQGRPRHDKPWTKREARAFDRFKTPNQLAEALSSHHPELREEAAAAMRGIAHLRRNYKHYLGSVELLEQQRDRIFFVGTTENLTNDFSILRKLLNVPENLKLPHGEFKAHRTPEGFDTHVTELGRTNLHNLYVEEYRIYEWCLRRRMELLREWNAQSNQSTRNASTRSPGS
jgi:hypothetical protein